MIKRCSTCNRELINEFVEFKCPACGKSRMVRCMSCEQNTVNYTCTECGFIGP